MKKLILLFVVLFVYSGFGQEHTIDSSGYKLQNYYLSLHVDTLWLPGNAVDWVTGVANTSTGSTHCSAFVAAACERIDTYILRPPDHSQTFLANAQFDWLQTQEAAQDGWTLISDTNEYNIFAVAQDMANKGYVVTAVVKNPDTTASGHIALVMPGQISPDSLNANGPFVIMAGTDNYNCVSLLIGFSRHIISWPEKSIWFYYNRNINTVSTITSINSGNWSNPGTWKGGIVPGPSDNVLVASGETITVDNSNIACKNISFENSTAHLSMGSSTSALCVYGDFTLGSSTHQVFSAWPAGAKIRFNGSALVQTLNEWNSAGNSTTFMEMEVDKSAGKVVTGGYNNRFCFGTSLNVINGTFELASTDDIETKNLANSGTQAAITVQSNGTFNMVGSSSYIRCGTFTGEETEKIGQLTIYGAFYFACGSTYKASFNNISIENGGVFYNMSGRGAAANCFNPGTVTVKNGGTFYTSTTTNVWYTNTTTPTTMNLQNGGTFLSYSSTTPFPPNFTNNGIVKYASSILDQAITDANYYRLELSNSGAGVNKNWTLGANRVISDSLEINNLANLILSAAASQSLTINGTIRLTSGSVNNSNANVLLTLANGALISRASGVFTSVPTFLGTVNLVYTNSGLITSGLEIPIGVSVINNLTMLGSGGITLAANAAVNGILTLTSGIIYTSSSNILTLGSSATVSGGSNLSFVNGPIAVTSRNILPMVAPVGKGSVYRPLTSTLSITSGSGIFTIEQIEAIPSGSIIPTKVSAISPKRYFHVSGNGNIIGTATIQLSWGNDDCIVDPSEMTVVTGTNGGQWTIENNSGGYLGNVSGGTISTNFQPASIIANADFTLGYYINPLPVSLTAFTASSSNGSIKLSWQTEVESNNHGFDIERSTDNSIWTTLKFILGQGNTNSVKSYSYSDNSISKAGKYYYRLKQIDINGGYKYSNIIEGDFILPSVYSLSQNYPNPFNPNTIISYTLPFSANVRLIVYNAIGGKVQVLENGYKSAGNYSVPFNGSNLPSGIYFYRIDAGNFSQVRKMMLVK